MEWFTIFIILHVAGGTIGLIAGTIAAAVIKGKKAHLLTGKIFFYAMLVTAVSALIISNLPGHHSIFLFAVGGFTLYMIMSGYRAIWLKRNYGKTMHSFSWIDYAIAIFAVLFGVFLLILAVKGISEGNMFGIVPGVFGGICLGYAFLDYKLLFNKVTVKQSWMANHITRMMGAMIASYTAFLVVNVHIQMQWILWVAPSAIGAIIISRFVRKYAPAKRSNVTIAT